MATWTSPTYFHYPKPILYDNWEVGRRRRREHRAQSEGGRLSQMPNRDSSPQYERTYLSTYPALALSPVRREGSTGPERPQRRRPDGQECYVERAG